MGIHNSICIFIKKDGSSFNMRLSLPIMQLRISMINMDIHNCCFIRNWLAIMDIHNWIVDIHDWIMGIHNSITDIHNLIMDIHNSIMDIYNLYVSNYGYP